MPRRIPCVGAVIADPAGRILLVRRARPPAAGTWSLPGGRVESGEDDATAVRREVLEETGLSVDVDALVGVVERDAPGGGIYVITDYRCHLASGVDASAAVAGDDAMAVGWFDVDALLALDTAPGLVAALRWWAVIA